MDDYDVYYVDGRNAVDHRTGGFGGFAGPGRVMVGRPPMGATGVRTVVAQPMQPYGGAPYGAAPYGAAPFYGTQPPGVWGPQGPGAWGPQGPWSQPGMFGPFGSPLLAGFSTGKLIDVIAQIFAALSPLPAAPVATSDVSTDVGNLTLYQSALASYAKKDEQIRTLGSLVSKLLG